MFISYFYIRKNEPYLLKYLEDLGYKTRDGYLPPRCELNTIVCQEGIYWVASEAPKSGIDCDENENMFKALAALRDDSDKEQWFISESGIGYKCCKDKFDELENGVANFTLVSNLMFPRNYEQFTKMSEKEIINYFKRHKV